MIAMSHPCTYLPNDHYDEVLGRGIARWAPRITRPSPHWCRGKIRTCRTHISVEVPDLQKFLVGLARSLVLGRLAASVFRFIHYFIILGKTLSGLNTFSPTRSGFLQVLGWSSIFHRHCCCSCQFLLRIGPSHFCTLFPGSFVQVDNEEGTQGSTELDWHCSKRSHAK